MLNIVRIEEVEASDTSLMKSLALCFKMAEEGLNAMKDEHWDGGLGQVAASQLKKLQLKDCRIESSIEPKTFDWTRLAEKQTVVLLYNTEPLRRSVRVECIIEPEEDNWKPVQVKLISPLFGKDKVYCFRCLERSDVCYCLSIGGGTVDMKSSVS